jgi:hypothetical protein
MGSRREPHGKTVLQILLKVWMRQERCKIQLNQLCVQLQRLNKRRKVLLFYQRRRNAILLMVDGMTRPRSAYARSLGGMARNVRKNIALIGMVMQSALNVVAMALACWVNAFVLPVGAKLVSH